MRFGACLVEERYWQSIISWLAISGAFSRSIMFVASEEARRRTDNKGKHPNLLLNLEANHLPLDWLVTALGAKYPAPITSYSPITSPRHWKPKASSLLERNVEASVQEFFCLQQRQESFTTVAFAISCLHLHRRVSRPLPEVPLKHVVPRSVSTSLAHTCSPQLQTSCSFPQILNTICYVRK